MHPERALFPDSAGYLALAEQLRKGGSYRVDGLRGMGFMRPPGYPRFLVLFQSFGLAAPWFVTLVQLLLCTFAVFQVRWIAPKVGSQSGATVAGVLYYLPPNPVLWAMTILSDTVFVFLLLAAAMTNIQFVRTRRARRVALGGCLLGMGALTRPVGIVLFRLGVILLVLLERKQQGAWLRLRAPLLFAAVSVGLLLPWALRNRAQYGLLAVSSIDVVNLGRYMAPAAVARGEGIGLKEARERVVVPGIPRPGNRARYLRVIGRYPLAYMEEHVRGTVVLLIEACQPNLGHLLGRQYRSAGVLVSLRDGDFQGAARALNAALRDEIGRWFVIVPRWSMAAQGVGYGLAIVGAQR